MGITLKDFQPINTWKLEENGAKFLGYPYTNAPKFLIDNSTGRRYLNEDKHIVGFKCFLVSLATPFLHPVASLVNVALRVVRLATFFHFWVPDDRETKYNFSARFKKAGKDLLRIIATPLGLLSLELAALYGLFRPYDGRKLCASIERGLYGHFVLVGCQL